MSPTSSRPAAVTAGGGSVWMGAAPLVALLTVGLGLTLGWRGVDVAGSVHRVMQFRHDGFTLWDDSWYGGQWTLNYSVAFAAVASTLGLHLLALLAAAVAALAFERIVTRHFGRTARAAAIVFAVGTVVASSIGQLPFLSGEALALTALWAATRRWWLVAWPLAAGATLLSPLAGAFVALGAVAWFVATPAARPTRTGKGHTVASVAPMAPVARAGGSALGRGQRPWAVLGLAGAVALPILVTTVLFPGEGAMPFPATDCIWDLAIAAAIFALTPRRERVLRAGTVLYALLLIASFAVASPLGGNAGRLGDDLALPLAVLLLWPRRRLLLCGLALPLVASGWSPAWGAMTSLPSQPSSRHAFYVPLDRWLAHADPGGTVGRVEVVPTAAHWESVWVANVEPLARGWERQSDVTVDPLFYRPGRLTGTAYRAWLLDNGVGFVALPAAPLDYAAAAEGRLVAAGVPGLRPVWHDRDWRVWAVTGSTGLVSGPGAVVSIGDQRVVVRADRPGPLLVRVAWDGNWAVTAGDACATAGGHWTRLEVARPGTIALAVKLGAAPGRCRSG